jgi:hypothetical protein
MLPIKFWFIWPSGFRGEDFFKWANQKQELPVAAMSVNGSGQNLPQATLVSDWVIFLDFSPLKQFGQMNRNLVGCIYGRSSIKIAHFVPIH